MASSDAYLRWLSGRYQAGRISRREFLGCAAAAGMLAAATTALPGLARAEQPKRGGRLVIGSRHGSTTDATDPAVLINGFQWMLAFAFSETLTEYLPDGTIGPVLAESWESSDAKAWSFKLRKGVQFHNGKTVTPEDIIASINHHRGDDSKSFVKPIASQIEDIKADGPDAILITLKTGNADFPISLNTPGFTIFPAADGKIDWQSRNGTGGYVIKDLNPGVHAHLERNPNYWRTDRAFADQVTLLTIADPAARLNALVTGDALAIDDVDLKTVELLKRRPEIEVEELTGPLHYAFSMRTDVAPFNNVDVRKALKFALDREEFLAKIMLGHGTVANDNPIGPSYRYYAADLEKNSYDPEKAKFHLKQAGMDTLKVDLSAADAAFAGAVDAAVLYQQSAAKAGIEINLVREPNDGYWDNVWMKKSFLAVYWGGYPTESEMFSVGYAPGAAWNDTFWTQERFEALRLQAQSELDDAKRREMYREMQAIVRDEGGMAATCFANYVTARHKSVQHGPMAANNAMDGRRAIERWWIA